MALIKVMNLSKIYGTGESAVVALDRVSFSVAKGEFVVITGPSGSGKSTLMNILGCLDRPSSGMYYLRGKNVSNFSRFQLTKFRNRSVGFIFQDSNLIQSLTAEENVELPLMYRGVGQAKRKRAAVEALERVGLASKTKRLPNELSGGQRQRVAIARAIAAKPDIILADEPTGSLDSQSGGEIIAMLRKLSSNGSTVIIITHDDSLAESARRVITIRDGRAEQKGLI